MRTKILVVVVLSLAALLIAAALWLASDAPTSPTPPRLIEPFHLRACRSGSAGEVGCEQHRVLVLDATINALRREVVAAAPYAAGDFVASEHAWYAARQSQCAASGPGASSSLTVLTCLANADRLHVGALRERFDDAAS